MEIHDYRRGPIVGRGASATVSLATSVPSGQLFAVKSSDLAFSGPLQREQSILSALDSPFVISYLGFDVALPSPGLRPCFNLFVEYAPGGSLAEAIKKQGGRLAEPFIRSYARDVLGGLAYLHAAGVAHCDVKSQNVLLCAGGRAKLADFGCARRSSETDRRFSGGTPMFMAPEVARGEEQGAPADVWALGCTVIEMATGRPPWPQAENPVSALHRIAFSDDVPEFPSGVSGDCKDFLSKCLTRDPRERRTAAQLLRHPFVASCSEMDHPPSNSDANLNGVSPTSALDQAFWELLSNDDELTEQSPEEDPLVRMKSLIGGNGHNWAWDETWVTVRSHDRELTFPTTDPITENVATTTTPATIASEEYSLDVNHIGAESVHSNFDCIDSISNVKCKINVSISDMERIKIEFLNWCCAPINSIAANGLDLNNVVECF
ncbi:mitogen-activated protein kinase kinase kinase 17-like [Zingiber officinale]|uniref:Protein kinase domain-containing protein n=1 Tax=Zingiber officinale TaxID=94328 RepID=A0A8J5BKA7_ZINOF|nr:mitogen-activated protein kinase kinase kinase 17-like [Zingiber officinale]KAG6473713.1 hypothetical protein ZIOFF_067630 [Zingiber officinale]